VAAVTKGRKEKEKFLCMGGVDEAWKRAHECQFGCEYTAFLTGSLKISAKNGRE